MCGAVNSNKDETEACFVLAPYQKVTVTAEAKFSIFFIYLFFRMQSHVCISLASSSSSEEESTEKIE